MPYCPPNNATFTCTQAYSTVPPQWFDPQAWLFAFLVMGAITVTFIAIYTRISHVELGDTTFVYLLFIGMIAGSFVDAMLNIINYGLMLLILTGFALYVWRTKT